jgi:GLPGLI family protein
MTLQKQKLKTTNMKTTLLLALVCICTWGAFAQKNEGVISYEEKMNLHKRLPAGNEQMKAMIPEFRNSPMALYFKDSESIYKAPPKDEDDDDEAQPNSNGMVMKFNRPDNQYYKNYQTRQKVNLMDYFQQKYLITDSLVNMTWKIVPTETKKILGYTCMKATATSQDSKPLVAWFTDAFAVQASPASYNGLPGAVLEVDVNDGDIITVATKIEMRPLKKDENVSAPKGGKKTSPEEFKKIVDEKTKEMKANGGMMFRTIKG